MKRLGVSARLYVSPHKLTAKSIGLTFIMLFVPQLCKSTNHLQFICPTLWIRKFPPFEYVPVRVSVCECVCVCVCVCVFDVMLPRDVRVGGRRR